VTATLRPRSFTAPQAADFLALLAGNAFLSAAPDFRRHPAAVIQAHYDSPHVLPLSSLFFLSARFDQVLLLRLKNTTERVAILRCEEARG
jgi:hypothetical protein